MPTEKHDDPNLGKDGDETVNITADIIKRLTGDLTIPIREPDKTIPSAPDPKKENPLISPDLNNQQVDWTWQELKTRLHSEQAPWDIPEEIKTGKTKEGIELSPQQKFDMLVQTIYQNTVDEDESKDEFIQSYKTAKIDPNFKREDWIKSYNESNAILDLPSKDFLQTILSSEKNNKGERKYTDEQIKDYLLKKNEIELDRESDALKGTYKQKLTAQQIEKQKTDNFEYQKQVKVIEEKRIAKMDVLIKNMETVENIGGFPHTESDRKEFEPVFRNLLSYNEKSGQLFLDDYLQSDSKRLYNTLYLIHKNEKGALTKYISDLKEGVKQDVLNKTGLKPSESSASGSGLQQEELPNFKKMIN